MQLTMLPYPLLSLLFFTESAAAQGFWDNCSRWALGWEESTLYRNFMVAECTDEKRQTRASFIPLSDCLANIEGEMVATRSGGLASSCARCTFEDSFLTCQCARTSGGPITAVVDLNDVIKNNDGIIGCHDFLGVEIDSFNASPA